jgi:hypothetical protein
MSSQRCQESGDAGRIESGELGVEGMQAIVLGRLHYKNPDGPDVSGILENITLLRFQTQLRPGLPKPGSGRPSAFDNVPGVRNRKNRYCTRGLLLLFK